MKNVLMLLLLVVALVACTQPTPSPTPTPDTGSVATPTAAPVASATTAPVDPTATTATTATPAPVDPTATQDAAEPADVTPTAVVDPAIIPEAAIMISEPWNGSKVTSPLTVVGESNSSFEQSVIVRLVNADGTEIATQPGQIGAPLGERGPYSISLDFEVSEVTPAFIQVFTDNPMDGGVTTLSSVGVQLLPAAEAGQEDIVQNPNSLARIVVTSHTNGDVVTGGEIAIEGFGLPTFESTFVVELIDSNGDLLGREAVTVNAPMGQYGYFAVTFPYTVNEETPTRIVVRDISPAFGGDAFVSSVLVRLAP